MSRLLSAYVRLGAWIEARGDALVPLLARLGFAAVLLVYFWASALTKLGAGPFGLAAPSVGAYAQILPRASEAAGYDVAQLALWQHAVVLAGTWAEFILPAMIVAGLLTRLAALGTIGFVLVQSLTDIFGHGATDAATLGAPFDRVPDAAILDQRLLWCVLLATLVIKGAGPLSLDALLSRRARHEALPGRA